MTDLLARLGIARVLNAAGTLTRLGGAVMDPAVAAAMAEAAELSVDMWALQEEASRRIAAATGAEAGLVTTGASAGLTLAAAATLAKLDPAAMDRLPEVVGPREIVVPRTHLTGYARALRTAGATLREVGIDDRGTGAGIRGLESWEVEAAIGPNTVALAASANQATEPDLPLICEVGWRHGLPVIVDAAAQLPPRQNLRRYVEMGATLVVFSGGKAIRGPQATGILAGRRSLVASAALQMLDMDLRPQAFSAPEFFPEGPPAHVPRHGIGRGFKASKENIAGLLVALDRFCHADLAADSGAKAERLGTMAAALAGVPGLSCRIEPGWHRERAPRLALCLDPDKAGIDGAAAAAELARLDPPAYLVEGRVAQNELLVDLACLPARDDEALVAALRRVLS